VRRAQAALVWFGFGPAAGAVHGPQTEGHGGRRTVRSQRWVRWCALAAAGAAAIMLLGGDAAYGQPIVLAQTGAGVEALQPVFDRIRNVLMGLAGSLALMFFTVAALRYLAADGDPAEITRAKLAFRNCAIGFSVAVLTPILFAILQGVVSG
jgi:type IV secretion system pilin